MGRQDATSLRSSTGTRNGALLSVFLGAAVPHFLRGLKHAHTVTMTVTMTVIHMCRYRKNNEITLKCMTSVMEDGLVALKDIPSWSTLTGTARIAAEQAVGRCVGSQINKMMGRSA